MSDTDQLTIYPTHPNDPEVILCVKQYLSEVSGCFQVPVTLEAYPGPSAEEVTPPQGVFLIACHGASPVGCAALTTREMTLGYISRMWVAPSFRGHGLAARLLEELERWSRDLGHRSICLYTHRSLRAAQRLYDRCGYLRVAPMWSRAPFADIWFQKNL